MEIGDRIRLLRLEKRLTQGQLGMKIGVKTAAIYKYEKGLTENIPRKKIMLLAQVLSTTPEYLLGLTDNSQTEMEKFVNSPTYRLLVYNHSKESHKQKTEIDESSILQATLEPSSLGNCQALSFDRACQIAKEKNISLDAINGMNFQNAYIDPAEDETLSKYEELNYPVKSILMSKIQKTQGEIIAKLQNICGYTLDNSTFTQIDSNEDPQRILRNLLLVEETLTDYLPAIRKIIELDRIAFALTQATVEKNIGPLLNHEEEHGKT